MSKQSKEFSKDYEDPPIKILRGTECIRLRPAMFIGDTRQHGLHHLLFECVDNSIDEFLSGTCRVIECAILKDGSVSITDDGSGISLKPTPDETGRTFLECVLSQLHVPSNPDRVGGYKVFSGGLRGVGLIAVNALSEWLTAEVHRGGQIWNLSFVRGELTEPLRDRGETNRTGTEIRFKPDAEIFDEVTFDYDRIRRRMWELSFLVPGITLRLRDDRIGQEETFHQPKGLTAFVEHLNQETDMLFPDVFTNEVDYEGARVGVAFQPTYGFETRVCSFVNSEACSEGTHIKGFRAGLKRALDHYGKTHGLFLHQVPTIEHYYQGMTAVISVWLDDPMYEGPTRFKLGNVEMARTVADVVRQGIEAWAAQRPECIHHMIEKAVAAAEADMKE